MNKPNNLASILDVYRATLHAAYSPKSAANRFNRLQCALRRVLAPGLEAQEAQEHMQLMPPTVLESAWFIQLEVFEQLNVSESLRKVDRGALRNFITWCAIQLWWTAGDPFLGEVKPELPEVTLLDVVSTYEQEMKVTLPSKQFNNLLNRLNTTIRRYLLVGLGLSVPQDQKPTQQQKESARQFMEHTSGSQLKNAMTFLEIGFNSLDASAHTRKMCRSTLNALLDWAEKQVWWQFERAPLEVSQRKTYLRGFGRFADHRSTERDGTLPNYSLRSEEFTAELTAELKHFKEFWTDSEWDDNTEEMRFVLPVKPNVAVRRERILLRLLGWIHRYEGIPLEELNFEFLIPVAKVKNAEDYDSAEAHTVDAATHICRIGNQYNKWLRTERGSQSAGTWERTFETLVALAKYQYRGISKSMVSHCSTVVKALNQAAKLVRHLGKDMNPEVDESLWWQDLDYILKHVTEELRYECDTNRYEGPWCSDKAIANTYKTYVLAGLLTYRAPRRIGIFQNLKFLPELSKRPSPYFDAKHAYLFKDKDGKLKLDLAPQSYKTGKTYGRQVLEVPNLQFSNNRTFYDYIQTWIDFRRSVFQPEHNFFFCNRDGDPYTRMSNVFTVNCYRLTGKSTTPKHLRTIYASYYLDQDYSDAVIRSLAWELGHSEKTLREAYDKRRTDKKPRPEQVVRAKWLEEILNVKVA